MYVGSYQRGTVRRVRDLDVITHPGQQQSTRPVQCTKNETYELLVFNEDGRGLREVANQLLQWSQLTIGRPLSVVLQSSFTSDILPASATCGPGTVD